MKIFTVKKVASLFLILAIAGFSYAFFWQDDEISYITEDAKIDDLKQIVDVNATTESNSKISLRFQNSGQVESINFQKGDTVLKNDLLASLENESLKIELEKAKANLDMANAELNLKYAGPTEEEKLIAWTKVEEAELNLKNANQIFEDTKLTNIERLKKAELDYENAKLALENAEKSLINTEGSSENSIKIAEDSLISEFERVDVRVSSAYDNIKIAINAADNILGIENKEANDDYEDRLGTKDFSIEIECITAYDYASKSLSTLKDEISNLDLEIEDFEDAKYQDNLYALLLILEDTLNKTKTLLDKTYQLLEYTPTNQNFTNTELQALKNTISPQQTTINSEILNTESLIQSIDLGKLNLEKANLGISSNSDNAITAYETAENNLKIAETSLSSTKVQNQIEKNNAQMQIDLMEIAVKQANANYDNLVKDPRSVDTAGYRAKVDTARAAYRQVEQQMEDSRIFAPMKGMIIDITKEIGENISSQEDMIIMMTEKMQLKANVSETDINKLSVGDPVKISFDSLPITEVFDGTVSSINPAETVISGVIYYEAYVSLDMEDSRIKSGMTADLEIETDFRKDVLLAPIIAIDYEDTSAFIYILEGGKKIKKELSLGLEGEEYVEVLDGIKEGDKIIIYEK